MTSTADLCRLLGFHPRDVSRVHAIAWSLDLSPDNPRPGSGAQLTWPASTVAALAVSRRLDAIGAPTISRRAHRAFTAAAARWWDAGYPAGRYLAAFDGGPVEVRRLTTRFAWPRGARVARLVALDPVVVEVAMLVLPAATVPERE